MAAGSCRQRLASMGISRDGIPVPHESNQHSLSVCITVHHPYRVSAARPKMQHSYIPYDTGSWDDKVEYYIHAIMPEDPHLTCKSVESVRV